ncbi:hypothetical protein An03g01930 [Aspergillus niger]|uniref:Uncharacterized protein n=2 Tax=Aspergillus niger TaxID=5061 RepID=A2QG55_ASPNC|nr:hypothetical protein An03g01930 [Aspergillus niger]CAK38165.1 hypothetical protein An03g01930 [Aspergillus niger]
MIIRKASGFESRLVLVLDHLWVCISRNGQHDALGLDAGISGSVDSILGIVLFPTTDQVTNLPEMPTRECHDNAGESSGLHNSRPLYCPRDFSDSHSWPAIVSALGDVLGGLHVAMPSNCTDPPAGRPRGFLPAKGPIGREGLAVQSP